ncbi:inosine-guanosine kinase [Klebsiella aerogenes]|nr:inosine-guanosine kinase [Klebsiella aerogenes]
MHNYSVLADDRSVLLGVMCSNIDIGGYAYRYLCNTSSRTDLNYLQGVDGAIGRCFTLISDSGERTFAISPGHMNKLRPGKHSGSGDRRRLGAGAHLLPGTLQAGRADARRHDEKPSSTPKSMMCRWC